jgi:hypothetical protein
VIVGQQREPTVTPIVGNPIVTICVIIDIVIVLRIVIVIHWPCLRRVRHPFASTIKG